MKKIIYALLIGAISSTGFSAECWKDWEKMTEAQFRARLAVVLEDGKLNQTNGLQALANRDDLADLRAEVDEKLAAIGLSFGAHLYDKFPKMSLVAIERWKVDAPVLYSVFATEPVKLSYTHYLINKADFKSKIALLNESLSKKSLTHGMYAIGMIKNGLIIEGQKIVKRYIRSKGKSFVTQDGVNPVAEHLNELSKALDAPKFEGLNKWLEDHDRTERLVLTNLPDDAAIAKLKEAVLFGDVEFNDENKLYLTVALGVKAYNDFVKEYNGEE